MNKEKDYNKIINRLFILIGIGLLLHAIFLAYTIDPKSLNYCIRSNGTIWYLLQYWPYRPGSDMPFAL